MLVITIPSLESWDEEAQRFVYPPGTELVLAHSLISLSKWESRFEKPFLSNEKKTEEETYGYIQAMSAETVSIETLNSLSTENMNDINKYIESKHSATWFKDAPGGTKSREIITSEVIYYWLLALQIPKETETWHLNRLFTLIKVVNEKNQPKKKMGRAEQLAQQRKLNEQRLREGNTAG